jgi:RNA polymerase sigma-70 factor (ECF subfamily)
MGMDGVAAEETIRSLQSARSGDESAFGRLIDAHGRDVLRVCFTTSGDLDVASDAAQNTWIRVWDRLGDLKDDSRFRAWLLAIAANEARQLIRSGRRRTIREISSAPIAASADEDRTIDHAALEVALARLSVEDRQLLALRYVGGLSAADIGEVRGLTDSGVRGRLSRITARLREDLRHG